MLNTGQAGNSMYDIDGSLLTVDMAIVTKKILLKRETKCKIKLTMVEERKPNHYHHRNCDFN